MAQRELAITILADGRVELHVKGFKGRKCLEVIKVFEKVLGEVQSQEQTNEFYEPEEQVRFRLDQRL